MKKKKIIIITGILSAGIIITAVIAGIISINDKKQATQGTFQSDGPILPTSVENVSNEFPNDETGAYKMILNGNKLMLYFNDELLNETTVASEVLPRADVKALSDGIAYKTIEDALVDWESLCN